MRPLPAVAGLQLSFPGSVTRAVNPGSSADPMRDRVSAMPLAVTHFMNSRREGRMSPPPWPAVPKPVGTSSFYCADSLPHVVMPNGTGGKTQQSGRSKTFGDPLADPPQVAALGYKLCHPPVWTPIYGDIDRRHESAPLSMAWVTGKDWKRWPVASKIAFR